MSDGKKRFEILNLKDPQLRKMALLIALGILGIALIFAGNLWPSGAPERMPENSETPGATLSSPSSGAAEELAALQNALQNSLEHILTQIDGVGRVAVHVTLAGGRKYHYERDVTTTAKTTEENDSQGGTRVITEQTESGKLVLVRESGSNETPVVSYVVQPEVAGVLVVAEGAVDSRIKATLKQAVQTLLEIAPHQVEVLPMKGGN